MRTQLAAVVPAMGTVLSVIRCGDGTDVPFTETEAKSAAEGSLLALEDFPEGWSNVTPIEGVDNPFNVDIPEECNVLNDLSKDSRSVAEARSDVFVRDPEGVTSHSIVYPRGDDAEDRIARLHAAVDACRSPIDKQLRRLFEEISDEGTMISIRQFDFEVLPLASFGDESVALRMFIEGDGPEASTEVTQDILILRVGNVTAGFDYTTTNAEPDRALEERLMATIEERAREGAASLEAAGDD